MRLTKNQIKLIVSLKQKKYRLKHQLFVVEGKKTVQEFLGSSYKLRYLYALEGSIESDFNELQVVSGAQLKKISALTTPQQMVAVFEIPKFKPIVANGLVLALDAVRDPGNLGTIIRLCDWFGVEHLVCSETTVDCYNPKVIQATMGSLTRVNVVYLDLAAFLKSAKDIKIGAFMEGGNLYQTNLPQNGILVMGNEANGISPTIEALLDQHITIPSFSAHQATESLNVAMATAILLSEFKRQA